MLILLIIIGSEFGHFLADTVGKRSETQKSIKKLNAKRRRVLSAKKKRQRRRPSWQSEKHGRKG
jgi:hypothetical protein